MIDEKNQEELIMLSKGMTSGDVLSLILNLIVFVECSTEDDTGDILKTMHPLLSLQTLAASIKRVYYRSKGSILMIAVPC